MPAVEGRIWKIRDPIIHVEGNMAHIYYYNVSQKPEGRSWLESALLLGSGDSLRITFMHSTKLYLTQE